MPFTPYHFGPHATVALPLHRHLDLFVFVGANVVVDLEPLLVLTLHLNYPLHGYCHTLLFGGLLGLLWAAAAYPFRSFIGRVMSALRLQYSPRFRTMAISGVLGAWMHVLFDAPLYRDIRPFFPLDSNPLLGVFSAESVYLFCAICFIPALAIYLVLAFSRAAEIQNKKPEVRIQKTDN